MVSQPPPAPVDGVVMPSTPPCGLLVAPGAVGVGEGVEFVSQPRMRTKPEASVARVLPVSWPFQVAQTSSGK